MTGVQWAVLSAYARTLPPGPERRAMRKLAEQGQPQRQGVALATAAAAGLGLLTRGRLTAKGEAEAWRYLRRHAGPLL